MNSDARRWELLLAAAAGEARKAVLGVGEGGRRTIGVGASGDKTLSADKAAEDAIVRVLAKEPGVRVLSEEAGELGEEDADYVAVVDPLDGSSNYSKGIPVYCTSIAVAKGTTLSEVAYACVLDLASGREFFAARGEGAKADGVPLLSSRLEELGEAVAGLDLSGLKGGGVAKAMRVVEATKRQVHLGANALELAMVGSGSLDCFVDIRGKMRVTDVAAGVLILEEAGGICSDEDGADLDKSLNLTERVSVVASGNEKLHQSLLRALNSP